MFTFWGNLLFFDIKDQLYPLEGERKVLAHIPKLGTQWKIIHEFNPTEYLKEHSAGLVVSAGKPLHSYISIDFLFPNIYCYYGVHETANTTPAFSTMESLQLPKIGEWTRIEISHEEVDGKYFLSFSVGGREAGRMEAGQALRKLTDVSVTIGHLEGVQTQPGFVRRLLILEKR